MAKERRTSVKGALPYEDSRSDMARSGVPFKPYVWNGGEKQEPPEVTAARERARAIEAHIKRVQAEADARLAALMAEWKAAREQAPDG